MIGILHRRNNNYLLCVIDATNYSNMDGLIYVADAIILDFLSCIWDYSFTGRPCFLFCSDLEK